MPKVRVTLSLRSGNAYEKADEVWLADLTGDLIREGTTTRSSAQISEEAARMGGSLSVNVGGDTTTIGGDVLSEYGHQMVELVADVVRNPKFPESELARLKANMLRNLAVSLSQPETAAATTSTAETAPEAAPSAGLVDTLMKVFDERPYESRPPRSQRAHP